jgi:hypothetical protein
MPDNELSESHHDVIDIIHVSGAGARIRLQDLPAWEAKGYVRGTVYPAEKAVEEVKSKEPPYLADED